MINVPKVDQSFYVEIVKTQFSPDNFLRTVRLMMVACISCAPAWREREDVSYNLFLFTVGFFVPLTVIISASVAVMVKLRKVGRCFVTSAQAVTGIYLLWC